MERSLGDHAFSRVDVSSLANPSEIIVEKVALNWTLDFEAQSIHGSVALSARVVTEGAKHICLDSRDLQISEVRVDGEESTFSLDPPHAALGVRISIPTPEHRRSEGDLIEIMISYSTSPHASAVQWLPAAATSGKEHPFVFTQSQAIHARSLFPCQDSPGVKHTYTAAVEAPSWCTVLMSALSIGIEPGKEGSRTHSWSQPVPVAPYLIALAAGDLRSSDVSERVRVWAEPSIVDAAAFEFAETETFLAAAESLTLPYAWGRYDVLCLPPSFPYGGMENPCLTFATPTLLAGDRSLADVIAHEIAHSWAGNLVTNATWEHFWLNEGLTVWLERKIVARTKGTAHALLSAQIGLQHLKDDLVRLPPDFSQLVWKLTADCDPDDAFSSVPYEKGFNLLYFLEQRVGSEKFEAFIQSYLTKYRGGIVTSGEFKDSFLDYFKGKLKPRLLAEDFWTKAFFAPGINLEIDNDFSNSLSKAVDLLAADLITEKYPSNVEVEGNWSSWSTQQRCLLLEKLITHYSEKKEGEKSLSEMLLRLDAVFHLSECTNAEIKFRWHTLCLQSHADFIVPHTVNFLSEQGRMKYVRPLYRLLVKVDPETAKKTFRENENAYHPIARKMIDVDLRKCS